MNNKKIVEQFIRLLELSFIDKAEDIAQMAHIGQTRRTKKSPYIIHPKRIQLLAKELKYGIDAQIVALLHDVIENSIDPDYYKKLIMSKFGNKVYSAIILLSHDKSIPYNVYLDKLASSTSDIAKLAFKVKMLDMYDNLRDNPTNTQYMKYKNAIQMLLDKGIKDGIPDQILNILGIISEITINEAPNDKKGSDSGNSKKDSPDSADTKDTPDSGGPGDGGNDIDAELDKISSPPSDAGGGDMGANGDSGDMPPGEENGGEDEKSITYYTDKLGKSKIIGKQRLTPDPGCKFDGNTEFYNANYISQSPKGSLLIAVPNIQNGLDIDFVKDVAMPKIVKVLYESIKIGKNVVLIGNNGLPYYDGKYDTSICGKIAKALHKKFKDNISFDTWNPKYFYSFTSNVNFWNEFKFKTGVNDSEMKSTLYLFLLLFGNDSKLNSMKTDDVDAVLSKWGFNPQYLNAQTHEDEIKRILFPDMYDNAETEASYIIKIYLQILRVSLIKKVIHYEKKGYICIVPVDSNTSWMLHDSFENLDSISKPKKETKKEPVKKSDMRKDIEK